MSNEPDQPIQGGSTNFSQVICFLCSKPADAAWMCVTPGCENFGSSVQMPRGINKLIERKADALAESRWKCAVLEQWKKEQLTVQSWWAEIDEFVRKHPDTRLGDFVSKTALRFIKERDESRTQLAGTVEALKVVTEERAEYGRNITQLEQAHDQRLSDLNEARTQLAAMKEHLGYLRKMAMMEDTPEVVQRGLELRSKINKEWLP